ncbi:MAG: queuosine precursor transporter [Bdellovibrionales bacterium]
MSPKRKREFVYLVLSGIFITNALLGELIGGKLIQVGPFTMSLGVLPWPVVFLTTDLINEYFGKAGVRNLTLFTAALVVYAFVILYAGMKIPAVSFSPVTDDNFANVFGQSLWIIVGSLIAFLISQLIDVLVFWLVRAKTAGRLLWLRATGSTAVSQLVDTFVIMGIAFYLPSVLKLVPEDRRMTFEQYLALSGTNYSYKLLIAVLLTPLIYLGHSLIDNLLGQQAEHLIEEAAESSLGNLNKPT